MLVVEIDGGYHDEIVADDLKRQKDLQDLGWKVIRFTDQEVEEDAEAVAHAIAKELKLTLEFRPRKGTGSGMQSVRTQSDKK